MNTPTVSLAACHYKAHCGKLELSTLHLAEDRFPVSINVRSHHTGRSVLFTRINEFDPLFDEDGWDGEQQVYRPVTNEARVKVLVIHRF
jgi:hypothetical protein